MFSETISMFFKLVPEKIFFIDLTLEVSKPAIIKSSKFLQFSKVLAIEVIFAFLSDDNVTDNKEETSLNILSILS